ncbi:MAG: hypothetical protein OEQ13_13535, partial [Acidobacteriota bacterium]|nr:hypothetical protein [Acidobacteriota bacterium]
MTLLSDYSASFARLALRPHAALTILVALLALALVWTLPAGLESASLLAARAEPSWAPSGADLPVIDDLPLRRAQGALAAGALWSLACIGAVLLFALGDAVLVRASSSDRWPGLREAWADAVRQALPLSVIAFIALAWAGGAALVAFGLIGTRIETAATLSASEWSAVALRLVPDAIWFALTAPVVV